MLRHLLLAGSAAASLGPACAQTADSPPREDRTLRLGVVQWLRTHRDEEERIVPPVYSNHLPKSLTYETLVGIDRAGEVRPGLAERWAVEDGGRRYVFQLRPGATFHDGSPCDAAAVKRSFESWLVRPQDRFIGLCERIERLEALGQHTLALVLRERYAALCDLALMNPMGIVGGPIGGPNDHPMIGSGPWRVAEFEPMRRTLFVRHEQFDGPRPQLARFEWVTLIAGADRDPVSTWALERGHVDALIESWRPSIPRDLARELVECGKARMVSGPGAMVQLLCFNHLRAPFAQRPWRRAVRDGIDREALVRAGEHGLARPCTALFAQELADWPDAAIPPAEPAAAAPAGPVPAELIVVASDPAQAWLAIELQRQLRPRGIDLAIVTVTPREHGRRVKAGEYDLYLTRTWGAPYDPQSTLYARFRAETPQSRAVFFADPELTVLIDRAQVLEPGAERAALYRQVQALLDDKIAVVPLYVPDRIALLGPDVEGIALGDDIYGIDLHAMRWR